MRRRLGIHPRLLVEMDKGKPQLGISLLSHPFFRSQLMYLSECLLDIQAFKECRLLKSDLTGNKDEYYAVLIKRLRDVGINRLLVDGDVVDHPFCI